MAFENKDNGVTEDLDSRFENDIQRLAFESVYGSPEEQGSEVSLNLEKIGLTAEEVEASKGEDYEFEAVVYVKPRNEEFYKTVVHNRAEMRMLLGRPDAEGTRIRLANNMSLFYDGGVSHEDLTTGSIIDENGSRKFWSGTALVMADNGVTPINMTEEQLAYVKSIIHGGRNNV